MDEADKLLNMDFEKEINQILELVPKKRNTYLFSATMTNKVSKLQRASLSDPVKIEVSSKYRTLYHSFIFIFGKVPNGCNTCSELPVHPGQIQGLLYGLFAHTICGEHCYNIRDYLFKCSSVKYLFNKFVIG